MSGVTLETPLEAIAGIGPQFLPKLKHLGLKTVKDLLWHFPTRYEDYSEIYKIADLHANQEATIQGMVSEVDSRRSFRRRLFITEAVIEDDTGSIRAVWFNQPYIKNTLQPGRVVNFSGKVSFKEGELYLSNPTHEPLSSRGAETKHTGRIVPIYPETRGLTSKGLRYFIKPILDNLEYISEIIPQDILQSHSFPPLQEAITHVHFPLTIEGAISAKARFAFEDLFFLQLYNAKTRALHTKEKSVKIPHSIERIKELLALLPFSLMSSQKKSLWEIAKDLEHPHPMNRLLQGDVGSGKTIVAAIAAILTAEAGYQTAFMAPTEILARQHYETFKKFFSLTSGAFGFVTGSEACAHYSPTSQKNISKNKFSDLVKNGEVKIIIGTHALIQKSVHFKNLGLVVVDEQHRFGVRQRQKLLSKNNPTSTVPHFLSMSATPIPRTLSLTLFGDLDLSLITELPEDRKAIETQVVDPGEREKAYEFIRREVVSGRQVFVICPRIEAKSQEEVEKGGALQWNQLSEIETKNVKEEYEKLSKKIFPDLRVGMLHGKLKAAEKELVMREFKNGIIHILVATSVVEVGVDIPNATIMMIEGAERFGLAQLYQFRGRVGRGAHQSYCLLFTESKSETVKKRLTSILEAKNGFELAEKDLAMRGPGQFLGATQTGMPDLAMKAIQNPELVASARVAAKTILEKDPNLSHHKPLKERIELFEREVHWE